MFLFVGAGRTVFALAQGVSGSLLAGALGTPNQEPTSSSVL